jgi:anaphase-promoting complex subunit 1
MASVTSLGVHEPVGLRHAIEQEILPAAPHPSTYTWDVITTFEDGVECEDELLTTPSCVIWSRGGLFRKSFRFDADKEPVTQALLAYFPASADCPTSSTRSSTSSSLSSTPRPTRSRKPQGRVPLSRALVVFLRSQAHIYFLSGTSHVVHMPFEVESACAAPVGVIIQRKIRADSVSVPLRLPKVPPASFVSSQLPPFRRNHGHGLTEFSTEGLGNPKVLPLRLSLTLENLTQVPVDSSESHWPRLVCLTDPLLELGLVVTRPETRAGGKPPRGSSGSAFLARSEEILHVESVSIPRIHPAGPAKLTIAVTVNRESNMYTVWRLSYLENEDPFLGTQKKSKPKLSRRRSSMAPGLASGGTTPVHSSTRESFGGALPGKKTRKSVKIDKASKAEDDKKALEKALSSLVDVEKGNERRQSRRVSSLLARADLSASQDRSTFAEQSMHGGHGTRRAESHGSHRLRLSSGYGGTSFGATFNYNRITHLPENPPVDNLLEELRAGGDFEGFHNMGLDDHEFDGLQHEILFTKIQSVTMDTANLRYSMSDKPARTQAKVFILCGPPTATDTQGRTLILIAIQDPLDKRLQLLTLHVEPLSDPIPTKGNIKQPFNHGDLSITAGEPRRVQSVVDSCKVSDGNEAILVLSEDSTGGRELSLQSPWGKVTTLSLTPLFLENPGSLEFNGSYHDHKAPERPPPAVNVAGAQIDSICHTNSRGLVHLRDKEGNYHRILIQLQPRCSQVRKVLDACRSVLHASHADKIVAGWWHIMRWLRDTVRLSLHHPLANMEWSAAVILLLASFLALGHTSETSLRTLSSEATKPFATNEWDVMMLREAPNSLGFPPWLLSKAWQHVLDTPPVVSDDHNGSLWSSDGFIAFHVSLAKRWMASAGGIAAFGFEGYLPTALNRCGEPRNTAAWSMLLSLHLLAEEGKLNISSAEVVSPGPKDLKAVLYQLVKWLRWRRYEAVYSLETQFEPSAIEELGTAFSQSIRPYRRVIRDANWQLGPFSLPDLPEPPSEYCALAWIHGRLVSSHGADHPTLSELYMTATRDPLGGRLRGHLWESLIPRTLMFSRLFDRFSSVTNRFDAVVAMHECGFCPRVLETLPESVLTPLQDLISACQADPPPSWSKDLLALVGRPDVSGALRPDKTWRVLGPSSSTVGSFLNIIHLTRVSHLFLPGAFT